MNPGGFEGFLKVQRRKDPGKPPSQHGLSGPGWTQHEEVVPPRRHHFEGPLHVPLPPHFREVPDGCDETVIDLCEYLDLNAEETAQRIPIV